jgi:predicted transposase YbfD/YdcC
LRENLRNWTNFGIKPDSSDVSSLPADPELPAFAARAHWGIENSLHHVLDVAFREDACTITHGNAPRNLNVIRKIALTLVRSDRESKKSIKKRLKLLACRMSTLKSWFSVQTCLGLPDKSALWLNFNALALVCVTEQQHLLSSFEIHSKPQ